MMPEPAANLPSAPPIPAPRWDGRRVLFEVLDRNRLVACAISMNALQDISAIRRFKPADLMRCFADMRGRIEAIALDKHRARSETATGLLNIWSDDIDDALPTAGSDQILPVVAPEAEAPDASPGPPRPPTNAGTARSGPGRVTCLSAPEAD